MLHFFSSFCWITFGYYCLFRKHGWGNFSSLATRIGFRCSHSFLDAIIKCVRFVSYVWIMKFFNQICFCFPPSIDLAAALILWNQENVITKCTYNAHITSNSKRNIGQNEKKESEKCKKRIPSTNVSNQIYQEIMFKCCKMKSR